MPEVTQQRQNPNQVLPAPESTLFYHLAQHFPTVPTSRASFPSGHPGPHPAVASGKPQAGITPSLPGSASHLSGECPASGTGPTCPQPRLPLSSMPRSQQPSTAWSSSHTRCCLLSMECLHLASPTPPHRGCTPQALPPVWMLMFQPTCQSPKVQVVYSRGCFPTFSRPGEVAVSPNS